MNSILLACSLALLSLLQHSGAERHIPAAVFTPSPDQECVQLARNLVRRTAPQRVAMLGSQELAELAREICDE